MVQIAGRRVAPGEQLSLELPLADLYTHSALTMPVRVLRGRRDGPTLFLSAAIHGDELNGVEIVRRVLRHRSLSRLRGTLIAVPVVNVHGFVSRSRYLPDRRDLNRSFPGSTSGSLAARMAHTFLQEVVRQCDYGIDLHTGAVHRGNLPQLRAELAQPGVRELAAAFAAPLVLDAPAGDGTLRAFTRKAGIPVVVYEAGEALRFDETSIRLGVGGVLNALRGLNMLPPARARKTQRRTAFVHNSQWVRSGGSGILRTLAGLGEYVTEGQILGRVADSFGDHEICITAPFSGLVIGKLNLPVVYEGEAVYHLAEAGQAERLAADWERVQAEEQPPAHDPQEPPIL